MDLAKSAIKYFSILCAVIAVAAIGIKAQNLSAAKILNFQGSVQISRASGGALNRIQFSVNDTVFTGDVIKTGAGGRLVLGLADGSQAIISENTTVEIKDTRNSPRTIFNILRGKTRIKIEKMGGKPNPYRVTTPTTVIAVRGTIFDVFVKGDKTEVFVKEGEVSVSNLFIPAQEVVLIPGQFTRVERETAPQPPTQFKPERNEEFFTPNKNRRDGHERGDDGDGNGGNSPGRNSPPRGNDNPPRRDTDEPQGDPRRRQNDNQNNPNRDNPPRRPSSNNLFPEDWWI